VPKKLIRRFLPDHKKIRDHKHLQIFGRLIHDANLWHLNRYSVSTAFSVGLFCAFIPIPFQMVLAGAIAIFVRSNLPISVALVWVTNPVTMPAIFYFCYRLGALILNRPTQKFYFQLSLQWLIDQFHNIGAPFLLGCIVCGLVFSVFSNLIIRLLWRISIGLAWQQRKLGRLHRLKLLHKEKKSHSKRKKKS